MKTLSPAVITLPWRQDAAEFYFSRLSHLPWAMLLHSGYADHPYSRFDIVVAEPICTLTTFGKETVVSESEKRTTTTDDPLTVSLLSHNDVNARRAWLESQQFSPQEDFTLTSDWQSNMTREQYGEKFRQVQEYLHSGDCYQVNLAQRFHATYSGDEWQAFLQLNQANRAPFSAFLRLEQGAILSLSPERFILCDNSEIQTRPIKGTLPRLPDPQEDSKQAEKLANSAKDRAENLMIVDLMRNDIGRVAVAGSVKVPELFVVEPFPAVHHLVSTITAQLPEQLHASDLLRAAFPGGSITGAPKVRAMEIIDELEPHRRNAWCGSIGYLSFCGNMDTSITIRTLTAINGQIYCSAGGGIVADSQEEAEYQETFDKVNKILRQLEK